MSKDSKLKVQSTTLFVAHIEVHVPAPDGEGWVPAYFEGEPFPNGFDSYECLKVRLDDAGVSWEPAMVKLTKYDRCGTRLLFSF